MMNNKKKRTLKGFTLIELIIVMAIVSVLMLAVMKVSQPAVKIMNNTSNAEKTYGYTDNIRTYLQTQLEYSDALWVIPENELGNVSFKSMRHPPELDEHGVEKLETATMVTVGDGGSIDDAVRDFIDENYFGTVSYNGNAEESKYEKTKDTHVNAIKKYYERVVGDVYDEVTSPKDEDISTYYEKVPINILDQIKPLTGKVNVLRLCNHDHGSFKAGQITLATYNFESYNNTSNYFDSTDIKFTGSKTPEIASTPETLAINNAYFEAYDAKDYTFSYALGAYDLEGDSSITGSSSTETFKVIPEDKDDKNIVLNNYNDLAVSILLNSGTPVDSGNFRAFRNPSQISVANIPLMNINYNGGNLIGRMYVNKEFYNTATASYVPQLIKWGDEKNPVRERNDIQAFRAFLAEDNPTTADVDETQKIDFTEDIYFIYSYATDLK